MLESKGGRGDIYHLPGEAIPTPDDIFGLPTRISIPCSPNLDLSSPNMRSYSSYLVACSSVLTGSSSVLVGTSSVLETGDTAERGSLGELSVVTATCKDCLQVQPEGELKP
jgi:hypothetical protein